MSEVVSTDMQNHTKLVHEEGTHSFYLVEENRAIGGVYYVRHENKCHWHEESYHPQGVAEAPYYGDGCVEYGRYVVGGTAFRTEAEALKAAVGYSESGYSRLLDTKASFERELSVLRAKLGASMSHTGENT